MTNSTKRQARDYKGRLQPMPLPDGNHWHLIETFPNNIELWAKRRKKQFAVVYGLQITQGLDWNGAAKELGCCILHALECDSAFEIQ